MRTRLLPLISNATDPRQRVRDGLTMLVALALIGCSDVLGISKLQPSGDSGAGGESEPVVSETSGAPSSGGATGTADCTNDADCDDRRACTGVELCIKGHCEPGVPYCSNREAPGCIVTCSEVNGHPACAVSAADNDGDGHPTSACLEAPGDDCDDEQKTVYRGAEELCDALDNDCDGKSDIDDGLRVAGLTQILAADARAPSVTFVPTLATFAVAYSDVTTEQATLRLRTIAPEGTLSTPSSFHLPVSDGVSQHVPTLIWGEDSFGLAWFESSPAGAFIRFTRLNTDGELLGPKPPLSLPVWMSHESVPSLPQAGLVRLATGDWILSWEEGSYPDRKVQLVAVSGRDFSVTDRMTLGEGEDGSDPVLAASPRELALAWATRKEDKAHARFTKIPYLSGAFGKPVDTLLESAENSSSRGLGLTAYADGFAVLFAEWQADALSIDLKVYIDGPSSAHSCGPSTFDIRGTIDSPYSYGYASTPSLISYPGGFAVLGAAGPLVRMAIPQVSFAAFDLDCQRKHHALALQHGDGVPSPNHTRLSFGAGVFMTVWSTIATYTTSSSVRTENTVFYRAFGESLCRDAG